MDDEAVLPDDDRVVIEVAVNGVTRKDRNPTAPETPDEVAADALALGDLILTSESRITLDTDALWLFGGNPLGRPDPPEASVRKPCSFELAWHPQAWLGR